METLGWIGGILLAVCSVPELIKTIKTKTCSLSWGFLLLWWFGELFIMIPVIAKSMPFFLTFNYTLNLLIISILIYYKARK